MKTSTRITFGIYDDTAKDDLTVSVVGDLQPFSNFASFREEEAEARKWATLEPSRILLDGSFEPFPDNMDSFTDWGIWGAEMTDDDGVLENPIVVTLSFTKPHASVGLTFHFDEPVGEWAQQVFVQWYDAAGRVLASEMGTITDANWFLQKRVDRFTKIVLTFEGTVPGQRYFKFLNIDYGKLVVFDEDRIISANLVEEISQTGDELSYNQLELQTYTFDEAFNILDPHSLTSGFRQRQKLRATEYIDDVAVPLGVFYLEEWKASSEHLTDLKAMDIIGVIENETYLGGVYGEKGDDRCKNIKTIGALIEDILGDGVAYEVGSEIARVPITGGWLPITTKREALKQAAIASRAIVDTSGDGVIKIYPRLERAQQLIEYDTKWLGNSTVEALPTVTGVEVTSHSYTRGGEDTRTQVFSDTMTGEEGIATFSSPHHTIRVAEGTAKILEERGNSVRFTGRGDVKLTGIPFVDNTMQFTMEAEGLPAGIEPNTEVVTDATLITPNTVEAVAENLIRYYNQNYIVTYRKILTPEEKIGSTQEIMSFRGQKVRGNVEKRSTSLADGFYADVTVRGYQVKNDWTYYVKEIITGGSGILL